MRIILCLLMMMTLTGCLKNISFDGLASTGGATLGATLGGTVSPPLAIAGGIIGGVATDVATPTVPVNANDFSGEDGELSFTELLAYMWFNFTSHLISIGIIVGILWILTGYLGLRMKRPEEKKADATMQQLLDKLLEK